MEKIKYPSTKELVEWFINDYYRRDKDRHEYIRNLAILSTGFQKFDNLQEMFDFACAISYLDDKGFVLQDILNYYIREFNKLNYEKENDGKD